jgi:PAS domain S-box-containing protein
MGSQKKEPTMQLLSDMLPEGTSTIFDNRTDGIAVLDPDGTILYLNAAWRHLLGSRDADALRIGNNYIEVLNAICSAEAITYIRAIEHSLSAVLAGEQPYTELEYPHDRTGRWRWFLLRISPYPLSEHSGVLIEQSDITEDLQARSVGNTDA